jgi:hypothetical protein
MAASQVQAAFNDNTLMRGAANRLKYSVRRSSRNAEGARDYGAVPWLQTEVAPRRE